MNIPYKNNKFINTLLLYIPTEKVKSSEYSNKKKIIIKVKIET